MLKLLSMARITIVPMNPGEQRFLFVSFEVLKKIKYSQLSKVCDKAYVFVNKDEKHIPFEMVKLFQKMGKQLKWVETETNQPSSLHLIMSFTIGKLHKKLEKETEFAILSNDESFDPLVGMLNDEDRYCVRVKQNQEDDEEELETSKPAPQVIQTASRANIEANTSNGFGADYLFSGRNEIKGDFIEHCAENTIKRLIRSGNRPSSLYLLKEYINLNNQELSMQEDVELVIEKLEEANEIKLLGEDIIYNF
jgi:hypothetical protein